jgi:hypothetical protein
MPTNILQKSLQGFTCRVKPQAVWAVTEWRALGDTWSVIAGIKTKGGVSKNETSAPVLEEKFRAGRRPPFRLQKSAQCFMVGKKVTPREMWIPIEEWLVGEACLGLAREGKGEVTLKVEHFIFFLLESEKEGSFLVGDSLLRTSRQGSSSRFRGPKRGDKFRPHKTT